MFEVKRFIEDESGATAIEYALIAAGIAVVLVTVVTNSGLGSGIIRLFAEVSCVLRGQRLATISSDGSFTCS